MGFEYRWHDIEKETPYLYKDVLLIDDCDKYWIGQWANKWYVYEGEEQYEITEFTQKFIAWTDLPIFSKEALLSDNDKKRLEKFRKLAVEVGDEPEKVVINENGSINIPNKLAETILKTTAFEKGD